MTHATLIQLLLLASSAQTPDSAGATPADFTSGEIVAVESNELRRAIA